GIRELHQRGVRNVILTNAAGGINLSYRPGELILISDHINLQGTNPLVGSTTEPRFPDMSEAYSRELRDVARKASGMDLREGVYAGLLGPSFETPAEIRYLRGIGADLVGMSTVLETIAANQLGMRVLGLSCVTNMAAGVLPQKLTHAEVLETGERVKGTLTELLRSVVTALA
ncbi:MAG: purine-nucleoside phosphorylase, partial [Acidobacteriota bacterium]